MAMEFESEFEKYEEYYGDSKQVQKIMNECSNCGAPTVQTHLSDYTNLIIQENSRCPDCGLAKRKKIHIIN